MKPHRRIASRCRIVHRRFRRDEAGVSALEFALILPIIMVMVLGLAETAVYIGARAKVVSGVDAALRYTMFARSDVDGIVNTALAAGGFDAATATVTVTPLSECSDGTPISDATPCEAPSHRRDFVSIRVEKVHQTLFPVSGVSDEPIVISRTGVVQRP